MKTYRTIIIDDEPAAIQRLQDLCQLFPGTFSVVAIANNGFEALELIRQHQPELIFLDIQMPEMSGFELLQQLEKIPLVIFCTAYEEYALKAFETNSIDYLLKPVKKERLQLSIEKLKNLSIEPDQTKVLALLNELHLQNQKKELSSITVRQNNRILFYKLADITYFQASEKYVCLILKNGEAKVTDKTLVQLEAELPATFLRIHRSIIINTDFIKEVQVYFNSRYAFVLNDQQQTKLISGRSYQQAIKEWMDR